MVTKTGLITIVLLSILYRFVNDNELTFELRPVNWVIIFDCSNFQDVTLAIRFIVLIRED